MNREANPRNCRLTGSRRLALTSGAPGTSGSALATPATEAGDQHLVTQDAIATAPTAERVTYGDDAELVGWLAAIVRAAPSLMRVLLTIRALELPDLGEPFISPVRWFETVFLQRRVGCELDIPGSWLAPTR